MKGSAPRIFKKYGAKIHDYISDHSVTGSEWLDYISDCSDLRVKNSCCYSYNTVFASINIQQGYFIKKLGKKCFF